MTRRHIPVIVAAMFAALLLVACGSSSKSSSGSGSSSTTTTKPPSSTSTSSGTKTAVPKLRLLHNAKLDKDIIVNPLGRTVYMYAPDGTGTTSTVPANIKKAWPPVVSTTGSVAVGKGLTESDAAQHKQANGVQQVSYNGHLLYTFTADKKAGDAAGQGLGGVWFAVNASGQKVG